MDVIHSVAACHHWENVAYYDYTFRRLMASKPWRSWSKTYSQGWNLAFTQSMSQQGSGRFNNNSGYVAKGGSKATATKDWCDDCCWGFNRNRCRKSGQECKYDHRCTFCGGWGHSKQNFRKRLKQGSGSDARSSSGSASTSSSETGNTAKKD